MGEGKNAKKGEDKKSAQQAVTLRALAITEQDEYKAIRAYIEERDSRKTRVNLLDQRAVSTDALEAAFHRKLKHLMAEIELTEDPHIRLEVYESAKTYFARQSKVLLPHDHGSRVFMAVHSTQGGGVGGRQAKLWRARSRLYRSRFLQVRTQS